MKSDPGTFNLRRWQFSLLALIAFISLCGLLLAYGRLPNPRISGGLLECVIALLSSWFVVRLLRSHRGFLRTLALGAIAGAATVCVFTVVVVGLDALKLKLPASQAATFVWWYGTDRGLFMLPRGAVFGAAGAIIAAWKTRNALGRPIRTERRTTIYDFLYGVEQHSVDPPNDDGRGKRNGRD